MSSRLRELFEDQELREKIGRKLPILFHLAELAVSNRGSI